MSSNHLPLLQLLRGGGRESERATSLKDPFRKPVHRQHHSLLRAFFLCFLAASFLGATPHPVPSGPDSLDWKLDATVSGVEFYYALSTCKGESTVFLKFNNRNSHSVTVSWKETFTTRQVAEKTEGAGGEKELLLQPGTTSETDCKPSRCKQCVLLPAEVIPAYKAEITAFGYKDIFVTKVR